MNNLELPMIFFFWVGEILRAEVDLLSENLRERRSDANGEQVQDGT